MTRWPRTGDNDHTVAVCGDYIDLETERHAGVSTSAAIKQAFASKRSARLAS